MARTKLIPMSEITVSTDSEGIDSVARKKRTGDGRALDVLFQAKNAWDAMYTFRKVREKNIRYSYGDQWSDIIDVDGRRMTEEEYIKSQGNMPLKNNIMRKLERSVVSMFRSQNKEPICTARDRKEQQYSETMSTVLQYNMQLNQMKSLHARTLEEFLMSGLAVYRKWYGKNSTGRIDCWTDSIQPNNFFIDPNMRSIRGEDCSLLGEIHDISFDTLCSRFVHQPSDFARMKELYSNAYNAEELSYQYSQFGYDTNKNFSFLIPNDPTRCRVIEIWRKEIKPRYMCHDYNNGELFKIELEDLQSVVIDENERRLQQGRAAGMQDREIPLISIDPQKKLGYFVDEYWYYYMLTPTGDILEEGETPYRHHEHPYVFCVYPFIDGEIHPFASDFIDQQRYINRLITMHDWIMRASAKGVLLFPEDCLPEGMNMSDIADEWSRFNGIIAIKKGAQNLPQQIANNSTNIGITELLNLQLKLIEDISGVSGSLQGKPGFSGMSASLYAQQAQNSATNLLDILETYSGFIVNGAYKDVKNIQQYYDDKKIYDIAGKSDKYADSDPGKIGDVEFDLSIIESTNTPVYRMQANDTLLELWRAQAISAQQLLEVGDFPFADELLQSLKSQQEQLDEGKMPESGVSPELMQQAQQNADMNSVNKAYDMLKGA